MAPDKPETVPIPDLYTRGTQEVNKILAAGNRKQRAVALQTLRDLTAMMLAHTLETIQGRTALLTGLITELTEITASIQVAPPYLDAVKAVGAIIDSARVRLAAEKKNLLPADA